MRATVSMPGALSLDAGVDENLPMTLRVAFLRAINVAGHGTVKMDALKSTFEAAGCKNVQSYIQSGNILYEAPAAGHAALARKITARVSRLMGGEAFIIFRPLSHLVSLVKNDPFAAIDPGRDVKLYVAFLAGKPRSRPRFPLEDDKERLEAVAMEKDDVFIVSGKKKSGFYGFPNNFIEKKLGVAATSRNWNTVRKIVSKFG